MALNKSQGNMYGVVTHTWNTVRGICSHFCSYCYLKKNGFKHSVRFEESELSTDLGNDNFIFVGSSCDMFAKKIPSEWIIKTIQNCNNFNNDYLFQTKNPERYIESINSWLYTDRMGFCTTIDTNRYYPEIMKFSPTPLQRAKAMNLVSKSARTLVTIEPIMDFDLDELVDMVKMCNPMLVVIGADSKKHGLPEPDSEKIVTLINELSKFVRVIQKSNLSRLVTT